MNRFGQIILGLVALLLVSGKSITVLATEASSPQDCHNLVALALSSHNPLFGSTSSFGAHRVFVSEVSEQARTFLKLVDVGLANVQTEGAELLTAITRLAESPGPANPFLNLQSPMGRALAARSEPIIDMLQSEWPAIQEQVRLRISARQEIVQKSEFDQEATKEVMVEHEIPFTELEPNRNNLPRVQGEFRYLGQTDLHHVVVVGPRYKIRDTDEETGVQWGAYLISKSDGSVAQIPRNILSVVNENLRLWVRDGLIVGVHPNSNPFRRTHVGAFEFAPAAEEFLQKATLFTSPVKSYGIVKLQDHILARNGQIVRTVWAMHGGSPDLNAVFFKFDWQAMTFINQQRITLPEHDINAKGNQPIGHFVDADRFASEWISLGPDVKTNGTKTVRRDRDSEEWKAWSAVEGMKLKRGHRDSPSRPFGFVAGATDKYSQGSYMASLTISESDPNATSVADPASRRSLTARWPAHSGTDYRHVLKPLNHSSLGVLYVTGTMSQSATKQSYGPRAFDRLAKIWLFDREDFKLHPVDIEVGVSAEQAPGWWRTIENTNGDLLFEYKAFNNRVVELFVLDVAGQRLRRVLKDAAPSEYATQTRMPLIDYDRMVLIGWVTEESLVITVTKTMSRGGGTK